MVKLAPDALSRPRWFAEFLRAATSRSHGAQPRRRRRGTADVLRRLRQVDADTATELGRRPVDARAVDGPFMLKGVMRADDAKRAVDCGVSAISVSNHGGNNLDGPSPPSGRCLRLSKPSTGRSRCCLTAASDGGRCRAGDRARGHRRHDRARVPLGPGRQRQAGVENVLDILRAGIDATLMGLGHSSIHELSPDDLVIPADFSRRIGSPRR